MKIKKIISAVLAAVVMLSLGISASAETMFDAAKSAKINSSYKLVITHDALDNTIKFTVASDTTITLLMESDIQTTDFSLYNSDGEKMSGKNIKESSGRIAYGSLTWNSDTEFAKGSVDYSILKGTYYLQFKKDTFSTGGNILKFKITDPNAKSVTALSLSITVDVGDTLDFGGVVSPSNSKITWKSSNTDVATVSSSGEVEAIAPGKATVTATAGGKTASITIIVN
jgi:uncharacterized protein YjdB